MAKTNNLTDFLTGLADKFRSKLGGTALINPQSFESKIDEVYQKGYDDAPKGTDVSDTTATAADVLQGKIFYGADGTKQTGEVYVMDMLAGRITNYGGTISGGSVTNDGNGTIGFYSDPYGFPLYLKGTGGFSVDAPYSVVAEAINLTADKIVEGNTILGVQGTASLGLFNIGSFDLTEGDTAVEIIGMPTTNFSWFEAHIDIISGGSPMSGIVSQYADQCIYKIVICDGFQGSHHVFLYKADGTQIVGNIDDVLRKTSSDMEIDFNQFGGKSIVLPTASFSYAMYY